MSVSLSIEHANNIVDGTVCTSNSSEKNYSSLFHEILKPHIQQVEKLAYTALASTNDFGTEVTSFAFPAEPPALRMKQLTANMKELAEKEGFSLNIALTYYYPRNLPAASGLSKV